MHYFKVRNFEQFQHYKHRNPPWIRLYYQLLHDRRFFRLDDASKWLAIGCFLLASQTDNNIPFDQDWIIKELSLSEPPKWQDLIESEFIQPIDCDASALLASCKQDASQSITDNSDSTEAEILSNSQNAANPSGRAARGNGILFPEARQAATPEAPHSPKERAFEALEVFKFWNSKSATMHHRAIDGQERAISLALRKYSSAEILRAIERYSQVRANETGKYRSLYAWTLGEFLSRQNHYNLERFNAENWEEPFLKNGGLDGGHGNEANGGNKTHLGGDKERGGRNPHSIGPEYIPPEHRKT
jgi:hypothetical protein